MALRRCSECGESLADRGPQAMTCGDKCRKDRSRRLRKLNERENLHAIATGQEVQDVAREVMKEEIRPVVREALTEEALRGIKDLLALTPNAVQVLASDMNGEDPVLAQRAAQTVIKYTLGHTALVRPDDTDAGQQIVVNFGLPRPDAESSALAQPSLDESVAGEAEELRTCDTCGLEKGVGQFQETSTRCIDCHEELRRKVLERVGAS